MRKLKRKYTKPREPWSSEKIKLERETMKKFGLRRKKELWRAQSTLRTYKTQARQLVVKKDEEKQKTLFEKLRSLGLLANPTLDGVLTLGVENLLERRLQSVVFRLGMEKTIKKSRQSIVHGHVFIDNKKITFPSYLVKASEEGRITVR